LEVYDVERLQCRRFFNDIVANPEVFPISENIKNLKAKEIEDGFDKLETYKKIDENVSKLKMSWSFFGKFKKEGKNIAAYSAPAKGNILLNYFGINENYLDFIVDKSEAKTRTVYARNTYAGLSAKKKYLKKSRIIF